MDYIKELNEKGAKAKIAARKLATIGTAKKNEALRQMAVALEKHSSVILTQNALDVANGESKGMSKALIDRLMLNEKRIIEMAEGLKKLADLPDPIGESVGMVRRPNGLEIAKVRVPLGVVGMIYEARPNVTVDAAGLCLKTGNAVILRGGSEAIYSNTVISKVLSEAATAADIPASAIQLIETTDRQAVQVMLKLNQYIDVIIPRGSAGLINTVIENSTIPVIETGTGVCHTFVDEYADLIMAQDIAFNAKVSRPGTCNSMETLLVHSAIAQDFLPGMLKRFNVAGVEVRGCNRTQQYHTAVKPAIEEDWGTEYLDLILSVKVVDSFSEAVEHIEKFGTRHSEAIVTKDYDNARRFQQEVDAAAVYVNASTRYTDGFEFGFGAEIGISTQKLHARGPMGLLEMTSSKYIICGNGQIRL